MTNSDIVERLEALLKGATARPWVAFARNDTLAIMKGTRPSKGKPWKEIVAWPGFDGAHVPKHHRRGNLHLIVDAVNSLPHLLALIRSLQTENQRLERENEAFREALEHIASYPDGHVKSIAAQDRQSMVRCARAALQGGSA